MKSYLKNLIPTKREHPGADEEEAPAGQSISSMPTTPNSHPVGCETLFEGASPIKAE